MADHLEIEQKFDVDADFRRPDFGRLDAGLHDADGTEFGALSVAAPVLHRLSATYFDTADGRLAARKVTLRRRTGGPDEGWHLKLPGGYRLPAGAELPAGMSSRLEVHAPLTAAAEVPETLAARVAEVAGGLPLEPIATLDTERTVVTVSTGDGRVLAEVADDVVTARRLPVPSGPLAASEPAPAAEPLRWREIEVEVPAPAPELQRAAADLLFAAGARPAGHGSKLGRLLNS
jgi:hypothetical protein